MTHRPAAGFTLLELMLATVLTVLLMMGVMMVIVTLRSSPALAGPRVEAAQAASRDPGAAASRAARIERWLDLLRRDLRHADTIVATDENTLRLVGPLGLDAAGRAVTHRPVAVTYRLTEREGQTWLFREQAALDLPSNRHRQRDLVLTGIQRFSLERRVLPPVEREADANAMLARAVGRTRTRPDATSSDPQTPQSTSESTSDGSTNDRNSARQRARAINGGVDLPEDHNEEPEGPQNRVPNSSAQPDNHDESPGRDGSGQSGEGDEGDDPTDATVGEARRRVAWSLRWTDGATDASEERRLLLIRMEQLP